MTRLEGIDGSTGFTFEPTALEVKAILVTGDFKKLIGALETAFLDFKRSPYPLNQKHHKFELAKDVSSFANAGGGLIVIGVEAELLPTRSSERACNIRPLSQELCDIKQYVIDHLKSSFSELSPP